MLIKTGGLLNSFENKTALVTEPLQVSAWLWLMNFLSAVPMSFLPLVRETNLKRKRKIRSKGRKAQAFPADLSQAGSAATLYAQIGESHLHVDLLINNAVTAVGATL